MFDEKTAELIITADGNIKNIVFVEELVQAAPKIDGWKFTALKPPSSDIEKISVEMNDYSFHKDNLFFYSSINSNIPDEINITIVYKDYNATNINTIQIGTFLFIDNFLGELNAVTIIDNINIIGPNETEEELIKIEKLNDFLIWREKEFIEKYESVKQTTDDDSYVLLEAKLKNGSPVIALMNSELLKWDEKASYQWILTIDLSYDGSEHNGLPNEATMQLFNDFEEDLVKSLNDENGQLNIGRETCEGIRTMYFACKDFREPSKIMAEIKTKYTGKIDMNFEIFKDKYWTSLNYFIESI